MITIRMYFSSLLLPFHELLMNISWLFQMLYIMFQMLIYVDFLPICDPESKGKFHL